MSQCAGASRDFVFHVYEMLWVDICVWQPNLFHPIGKYPIIHLFQVFYVSLCQSKNSLFSLDMGTEWKKCGLNRFAVWNIGCYFDNFTFSITFYVPLMQIILIQREGLRCSVLITTYVNVCAGRTSALWQCEDKHVFKEVFCLKQSKNTLN